MKSFLSPEEMSRHLPELGSSAGTPLVELVVRGRVFDPGSRWQWYLMEFDGRDELFGLVMSSFAVLGRFTLTELLSLENTAQNGSTEGGVVWDVDFKPCTLRELAQQVPAVAQLFAVEDENLVSLG